MSVILRPTGAVPCATRLRRGRSAAGNWCRLIFAVALIATALTAFLISALRPLPFSSVITPSIFAATSSSHRDSIIFPRDSRNSTMIVNSDTRTIKANGIDTGNKMAGSTRPELKTHAKEAIHTVRVLPASTRQERQRKEAKPHTGDRKLPPPDEALLYAKREIERAPLVADDPDLYAPVFCNLSVFKK